MDNILLGGAGAGRTVTVDYITSDGTATSGSDYYLGVTRPSTGTCTITLNDVSLGDGREIKIKDESGNAFVNNITVVPQSGTIDGAGSFVIDQNYESIVVISNGTNWFVN